jgi:hypothetical protein
MSFFDAWFTPTSYSILYLVKQGYFIKKTLNVFQHVGEFQSHVFVSCHGCIEVEILYIHGKKIAPGVEMMLLMRSFTVRRSAVGVPMSPG